MRKSRINCGNCVHLYIDKECNALGCMMCHHLINLSHEFPVNTYCEDFEKRSLFERMFKGVSKMMVFKCDRCGAIYERSHDEYDIENNNTVVIGFMDANRKNKFQLDSRYDLCPNCIKDLVKWIEGEKS